MSVTWANYGRGEHDTVGYVSIWTADVHFAGCESSSVARTSVERID
jgi:hypothetical protein